MSRIETNTTSANGINVRMVEIDPTNGPIRPKKNLPPLTPVQFKNIILSTSEACGNSMIIVIPPMRDDTNDNPMYKNIVPYAVGGEQTPMEMILGFATAITIATQAMSSIIASIPPREGMDPAVARAGAEATLMEIILTAIARGGLGGLGGVGSDELPGNPRTVNPPRGVRPAQKSNNDEQGPHTYDNENLGGEQNPDNPQE